MLCFVFIPIIIKIDHVYLLSISLSHTLNAFTPYGYVVVLSNVCNLLSLLLLSAILLIYIRINCDIVTITFKFLL